MARPSNGEDLPFLITMSERWVNSGGKLSVRSLAQACVDPLVGKLVASEGEQERNFKARKVNAEESVSKRLESKFRQMIGSGEALSIGINRELNAARYRYGEKGNQDASSMALQWVAHCSGLPAHEVIEQDGLGALALHKLLPNLYGSSDKPTG